MSDRPLVIITTRLPPATCGIGTYSWLLRRYWPGARSPAHFLVMDSAADAETAGDHAVEFGGTGAALLRELERIGEADVLLHYAGRAYHRLGCPLWLPRVLAQWKRRYQGGRLMLIVHEMPGRLPIRSRHYWLGLLNHAIVRRLARLATVVVTNTANHAAELRRITGREDVELLPVGSNIGKNGGFPERRRGEFAVFGLPFGRMQTLQKFQPYLRSWRIEKLHIIGPTDEQFTGAADEILRALPPTTEVVRHGSIAPDDVARILQRARYGLTNVTEETWSKSTTFMACAENGCAVVLAGTRPAAPPLAFCIAAEELETIGDEEVNRRSSALAEWYRANADWPVIASRMAALW
jgi:hypothetical protein